MSVDNLASESITFIAKAGEALGDAKALGEQVVAESVKIASLTPAVAAEALQYGLLEESEVASFTQKLASHEGALQVVRKLASLLHTARSNATKQAAATVGHGVDSPTSHGEGPSGCFVGSQIGQGQRDNAKIASEIALGIRNE